MNKRKRKKSMKKRGTWINPKDTWNLDNTIANFVLPRLKKFKEVNNGYPGREDMDTSEKWDDALDKMIRSFELVKDKWNDFEYDRHYWEERNKTVQEGLHLFAKWFEDLWW